MKFICEHIYRKRLLLVAVSNFRLQAVRNHFSFLHLTNQEWTEICISEDQLEYVKGQWLITRLSIQTHSR